MDFLLKREQIIVETKKTRQGLGQNDIGDQLIIDIARYQIHQDCKLLICFVYDPDGRITNLVGFEKDLSGKRENIQVYVVVAPKGT